MIIIGAIALPDCLFSPNQVWSWPVHRYRDSESYPPTYGDLVRVAWKFVQIVLTRQARLLCRAANHQYCSKAPTQVRVPYTT